MVVSARRWRYRGLAYLIPASFALAGISAAQEQQQRQTLESSSSGGGNETCQAPIQQQDQECGLWVAKSTLTGAGIGMFAGKSFRPQDDLGIPDHTVPIVDIETYMDHHHHHNDTISILPSLSLSSSSSLFSPWNDYYWNADFMKCGDEGITCGDIGTRDVYLASCGFGATANSFLDFVNVQIDYEVHPWTISSSGESSLSSSSRLHRSKDPGVGAFSPYQFRVSKAWQWIEPGDELFVSYGKNWFFKRKKSLGSIPVMGDHKRAEQLYRSFLTLRQKLIAGSTNNNNNNNDNIASSALLDDIWTTFVVDSSGNWESRVFAALPKTPEEYDEMEEIGLVNFKRRKMRRSNEWLQQHGVCADHLVPGRSTIEQAGNGAFASRPLVEGSIILPIPLIHIPNRSVLDMYEIVEEEDGEKDPIVNYAKLVGQQLLLNYCFGHPESTMLLSPYGPMINFVNHNQTKANVRLQWASPERSSHNPEWLEKEVWHFFNEKEVKVAMELVALQDIQVGEEVFLDYGAGWEDAWQKHLRTWKPVPGADSYESAEELNRKKDRLKTKRQLESAPYPSNVVLKFDLAFEDPRGWKTAFYADKNLDGFKAQSEGNYVPCEVLKYTPKYGMEVYSVTIFKEDGPSERQLIKEAPREAFLFHEIPYTDDIFLPNAFRHEIQIPDEMFPEKWKNQRIK